MRLFVALDLPESVRRGLAETIAKLQRIDDVAIHGAPVSAPADALRDQRWTRPENMHVTLKFIGHVAGEKLLEIRDALEPIRSLAPVELRYRGIGYFPDAQRPRVLYCGVDPSPNLAPLAADIGLALEPLGIASEARAFIPHLTLARFNPSQPQNLPPVGDAMQQQDFGDARETEFHLYESMLKPGGAEYKKLATYSFVKETRGT